MSELDLEHFRLKSLDLGQLTGVSVAAHAIPDAFLLLHSGVGCKHKATTQLSTHDWARGVVAREAWTEVGDASLISGSANRIAPYARAWHARMKPGVMFVVSVTFLDLTGDDFVEEVRKLDAELDAHVVLVKAPGYAGDLWSGYASAVLEVVRRLDWSKPADQPKRVSLLGYLWDRYEGDHVGNVAQIATLLKHLGLELGPVLLSGAPFAQLAEAPASKTILSLPYLAGHTKALARATKREITPVDLPIGIRGTSAFVRQVGAAARVDPARIAALVDHQERTIREKVGPLADRLRGMRVAVLADLPLLAGTMSLLDELGIEVALAGIRGSTLGGRARLEEALARMGAEVPEGCVVLESPSIARVRQLVIEGLRGRRLDGVIGSATDLNGVSTIPASEILGPLAGGQMYPSGPFRLEIGFPCKEHHATYAMPFMGYAGVLMWIQRLLGAPRSWDSGRRAF